MYSINLSFIYMVLLLLFGLFGNLIVMTVFSTKEFKRSPSRSIYKFLIIIDSITLVNTISIEFLMSLNFVYPNLNFKWWLYSEFLTKFYFYISHTLNTAYLLVFISIEKFITIRYSNIQSIKDHNCFNFDCLKFDSLSLYFLF